MERDDEKGATMTDKQEEVTGGPLGGRLVPAEAEEPQDEGEEEEEDSGEAAVDSGEDEEEVNANIDELEKLMRETEEEGEETEVERYRQLLLMIALQIQQLDSKGAESVKAVEVADVIRGLYYGADLDSLLQTAEALTQFEDDLEGDDPELEFLSSRYDE